MNKTSWLHWLERKNACLDAVEWCQTQKSFKQAWADCERGDWMLWILGNLSGKEGSTKRRKLVLVACKCARLSLKFVPKNEKRPRIAIETAEKWARRVKGVSIEDVRTSSSAAYAAASSYAAASYASYASYASASSSSAASAASYAAYAAAYASASYASAAAYEKQTVLKKCADIVRKQYPNPSSQKGV